MRQVSIAPKTLTDEEQFKLLKETIRSEAELRDHMLFALALGTGLQVSELVALNISDVKNGKGAKGLLHPETTKNSKAAKWPSQGLRRKVSRFLS